MRIQSIGTETETSKRVTEELAKRIIEAEQALSAAKRRQMEADAAIKVAEEAARAEGSDSGVTDTVVRQQLELRKFEADQAALRAQQRIDAAEATQKLAESVSRAERDLEDQEVKAGNAREAAAQSMAKLTVAEEQLQTFFLLIEVVFSAGVYAQSIDLAKQASRSGQAGPARSANLPAILPIPAYEPQRSRTAARFRSRSPPDPRTWRLI